MKAILTIIAFTLVIVSCKKQQPVQPSPPATITMSSTGMDLLGSWDHDSTTQVDINNDTFSVAPVCTNASITFTDIVNNDPNDLFVWDFIDNRYCSNLATGWTISNDTVWLTNVPYKILLLNTTNLVLEQGGATETQYFTKQ